MFKPLLAAAIVTAISVPAAAQQADTARLLPQRGIKVVPLETAKSETGGIQPFVLRPPQGTAPDGAQTEAPAILRPPQGETPDSPGDVAERNEPSGPLTLPLVAQPQGAEPRHDEPSQTQVFPLIVEPQGSEPADEPDLVADSGPQAEDTGVAPEGVEETVEIQEETAPSFAEAVERNRVTVDGVKSASDLYDLLIGGGYRVAVQRTAQPDWYLFVVRAGQQPFAHLLLVDDQDGSVVKHKAVRLAGYGTGYRHRPTVTPTYRPVNENCHRPAYRQSRYGRNRWVRY